MELARNLLKIYLKNVLIIPKISTVSLITSQTSFEDLTRCFAKIGWSVILPFLKHHIQNVMKNIWSFAWSECVGSEQRNLKNPVKTVSVIKGQKFLLSCSRSNQFLTESTQVVQCCCYPWTRWPWAIFKLYTDLFLVILSKLLEGVKDGIFVSYEDEITLRNHNLFCFSIKRRIVDALASVVIHVRSSRTKSNDRCCLFSDLTKLFGMLGFFSLIGPQYLQWANFFPYGILFVEQKVIIANWTRQLIKEEDQVWCAPRLSRWTILVSPAHQRSTAQCHLRSFSCRWQHYF